MNPRTTLVLGAIALALGAFVWLHEIRGGEARKQAEEQGKRVFAGLEADDVRWIELPLRDGGVVRLERVEQGEAAGWRITAPIDFPADAVAVDAMASALAQLTTEQALDTDQPPETYHLGASARVVRFGTADGTEHELRIGRSTPVGASTYVARGGEEPPVVRTVQSWRTNVFDKDLATLRDARVLAFDREAVRRIVLRWPDPAAAGAGAPAALVRVVLERGPDGWRMREPLDVPADAETVDALLSDLAYLRAEGFVEAASPEGRAARADFEPPDFAVELELEAPQPAAQEAAASGAAQGGASAAAAAPVRRVFELGRARDGRRLARGMHPGTLYVLPSERIDEFPRRVPAWRDRTLARFALGDARRVEIELARDPAGDAQAAEPLRVVLERASATQDEGRPAAWVATPPLREGVALDIVATLAGLRAEDVIAEHAGPAERAALGLEPPRARLRVFGEAAGAGEPTPLAEVWLGRPDAQGIPAAVPGSPAVFRLDARLAENLPLDAAAFEARFAAPPPAPDEAPARAAGAAAGRAAGAHEAGGAAAGADPAPAGAR